MYDYYQFVQRKAKTYALNANDIKMWHGKIFSSAVPLPYYAGNFRCEDHRHPCLAIDVGVRDAVSGQLRTGTAFKDVEKSMGEFSAEMVKMTDETDDYVAATKSLADHAKAAVQLSAFCEGRILQIHPFINGNGRMSRITADYFLYRYGLPWAYYPPIVRPGLPYERASDQCMLGDYTLLFEYLLTVTIHKITKKN
ncbi:MAG: Fic family protein [Terriglobales bacterium]